MGFTKNDYLTLHGENGITFSLFTELDDSTKIHNFLDNVKWNMKPKLPVVKDFQVHLFPSFGRRYGAGEPDVIIIYGEYIFFIEVETKSIDKLPKHFFKQLDNFNKIGEQIVSSVQKKIVGNPFFFNKNQRVYGQHRTKKVIKELLNVPNKKDYYIVITDDHIGTKGSSSYSLDELNDRIDINLPKSLIKDKLGWIGYPSINRLKANDKTKEVIQFNLKL